MKKITLCLALVCLAALSLAACSQPAPQTTTTTTPKTTTVAITTTTTTTPATDAESPVPSATPGVLPGTTQQLHGKITRVNADSVEISEIPQLKTCTLQVKDTTQLVGVTQLSELKEGMLVIASFVADEQGLGMAPDTATATATTVAATVTTPAESPVPETVPGKPSMIATILEVVETLPTLQGKITEVSPDSFLMEDAAEGKVKVLVPAGTLMEGLEQPAKDDTVTVVYSGRMTKSNPGQVNAISITKGEGKDTAR